jgi:hypothetical protein
VAEAGHGFCSTCGGPSAQIGDRATTGPVPPLPDAELWKAWSVGLPGPYAWGREDDVKRLVLYGSDTGDDYIQSPSGECYSWDEAATPGRWELVT